jgi:hypothetical protein
MNNLIIAAVAPITVALTAPANRRDKIKNCANVGKLSGS